MTGFLGGHDSSDEAAALQSAVGRPMEILLVEDSLVAAKFAIGALDRSGIRHRLTWMSHGDDAKSFVFQEGRFSLAPRPDLVLLDLNLPGLSGRQILQLMRSTDHLKRIAVVIMTGETTPSDGDEFGAMDVQGVLTKPVDVGNFVDLVERLKSYWKAEMIIPYSQEGQSENSRSN
ncbi:Response regulator rcp1 [Thalassoglobus neptunius]|uniref:Response regulator rcp1 n=1 Tax=Thalassoglobus neptunius TaxID=1938619 RepID=A0A5C5X7I6_9PLAN|nr:response regulator [Thalassoglobus neptunius]TWT58748.1 Response regulator rcp1 [Thalassoglobus neptunius]